MPRVEFDNKKQADPWIKEFATPKSHYGLHTHKNELILVPRKSTRPVVYARIVHIRGEDIVKLREVYKLLIVECRDWEWSAERAVYEKDL